MGSDTELELACAEYLEALDRGEPPDRDAFLERHKNVAEELRDFIQGNDATEQIVAAASGTEARTARRPTPRALGPYTLLTEIGRGGMGVVYLARHPDGSFVALKSVRSGPAGDRENLERFRTEARAIASLDHPNIIPILAFDEHDGERYFTMKLVDGGALDLHLDSLREDPKAAVRLVAKVARAVHHAHQRGIIHRDLKPGNILMDADGEPLVADWGIAKRLEGGSIRTDSGLILGTPEYMAPEQGDSPKGGLTTAADVYSLGVVLYELLTGRVPIRGETPLETLRLKREQAAPDLRTVDPRIPLELESICQTCLKRTPERRYGSAEALADDLEAYLEGRPPSVHPLTARGRLWRWFRRNPAMAGLSGLALALLALIAVAAGQRWAETETALVREGARALELRYTATAVADRVLMRIKDWAVAVVEAANDPELPDRLAARDVGALRKTIDDLQARNDDPSRGFVRPGERSPFESWYVFYENGVMAAYPQDRSIEGKDFTDREWVKYAMAQRGRRGLDSVHVSAIFQSVVAPNLYKFTLSAPVYGGAGPDAPVVGVIGASFTTHLNLGDELHTVVLAGPWDPLSEGDYKPGDYLIVMHPSFEHRTAPLKVTSPLVRSFVPDPAKEELRAAEPGRCEIDPDYRDPFGGKDGQYVGRWRAGLAPVGNTRFVAIVQVRPDPAPAGFGGIFLATTLVLFLGVVLAILSAVFKVRLRRTRR